MRSTERTFLSKISVFYKKLDEEIKIKPKIKSLLASHAKNIEESENYCSNTFQPNFSSHSGTCRPSRFKNQLRPLVGYESLIQILAERIMRNIPESNYSTVLFESKISGYPDVDDSQLSEAKK